MSLFSELETLVSSAIDTTMGERIQISPMKRGDVFAGSPDPDRQPVTVIGIIDLNPVTIKVQDQSTYDGFQPKLAGDKVHISIALSAFPSSAQYPQANDEFVALERPGMPRFRLTRPPDHDGIGRMVCICMPV